MDSRFARITAAAGRRPLLTLAIAALLSFGGALAAVLGLQASTSTDTLIDKSSSSYDATSKYRDLFGGDPVVIMAKGDLRHTVETSDLGRLLQLEGCLSGNVPKQGLKGLPAVCATLANENQKAKEAQQAAAAARELAKKKGYSKAQQEKFAQQASSLVYAQFIQQSLQIALKYGFSGLPSLDNVDFVDDLVFDHSKGTCTPKARFAYLFPNCNAALIQVRLKTGLSDSRRAHAIGLIEKATADPKFKPKYGAKYVVSGVPVVADALANEVQNATVVLLIAALVIMALTLALVFRTRMRLLPLALALAAAGLTFGLLTLLGGSLTMASVAALPILIGLAVDYAIQFQARFEEASSGAEPSERAAIAAAAGGPTIATAGLATATGFLVLLLSPIPMVRGFGIALIIGIVFAFLLALTAGFAALIQWHDRGRPQDLPPLMPRTRERLASIGRSAPVTRTGAFFGRAG